MKRNSVLDTILMNNRLELLRFQFDFDGIERKATPRIQLRVNKSQQPDA